MRSLVCLLYLFSVAAFAQEAGNNMSGNALLKKAAQLFAEGRYFATTEELEAVEKKLEGNPTNKTTLGLINYWKGIAYNRQQEYPKAIASFDKALSLDYSPIDLNYEYGQALYAAEKLEEARLQFRESLKKKFKRAVSLYYIAFLSRELGENKKAFSFFRAIQKLTPEEAMEVKQASELQIADIYLEQVQKEKESYQSVESYVIPQYKKALEVDEESALAPQIREKILSLQRKYDLLLFNLRNGRPALNPPYFFRLSQEFGVDTNVTFSPSQTTVSKSHQASPYSKTDAIGRYTFYYQNYISIAPELRFNNTYYFHRVPEIYRNDNMLVAPALRTAFEHTLWKKPASHLMDLEYADAKRDVNAQKKLQFSSKTTTFMLGERFNYFSFGESIVRLRHRDLNSYLPGQDSTTNSVVFEQIRNLQTNTLLFYASYDMTKVKTKIYDTNSLTFRTDLIMARVKDWFTPSIGLGLTTTDPVHNRAARGREFMINPSGRISKTIGKHWRANLKYDYQNYQSKDKESFAYKKSIYALELEYLF